MYEIYLLIFRGNGSLKKWEVFLNKTVKITLNFLFLEFL